MKSQQETRAIQRYLIKRVDEGFYTTDRGFQLPEKVRNPPSAALQVVLTCQGPARRRGEDKNV